jgi:hypothetical protein
VAVQAQQPVDAVWLAEVAEASAIAASTPGSCSSRGHRLERVPAGRDP